MSVMGVFVFICTSEVKQHFPCLLSFGFPFSDLPIHLLPIFSQAIYFFPLFWRKALCILANKFSVTMFIVNIFCQSVVWISTLFMTLFLFPQIVFILMWSSYHSFPLWFVHFVLFMKFYFVATKGFSYRVSQKFQKKFSHLEFYSVCNLFLCII